MWNACRGNTGWRYTYIIEDNVTGLLVDPKDVDGLCRALNELLFSNGKAEQLAKLAVDKVLKDYSSSIMAEKYLEIYEKVLYQ